MKTRILTQAEKPHNANHLHDVFIAAQIPPIRVESTNQQSAFIFQDTVGDGVIDSVIAGYALVAEPIPLDIRTAWQAYKSAINNATTVGQIKNALTNELGVLLKELFKSRDAGLS